LSRPFAVIAGGGTGGHIQPALAVASELVERGHPPSSLLFVGSRRGLEARLVPEAGYPLVLLPGRGIPRRLSLTSLVSAAGLALAAARAIVLLASRRPSVVLSVGGYASLPCALAAVVLRIPLVVTEQNARAGSANRLVARFARASAVAFPGTGLPREVVTGNPVRPEIAGADRSAEGRRKARAELDLPEDRLVLAVMSGSLGARSVNRATLGLVERWASRLDLSVHHAVGSRDWPEISAALPSPPGLFYRAVEYEDRMPLVLEAADLFLGRAGGTTVAELAAVGVASVLVPLPIAPGDHQTANGRALERQGAAVLVPDAECSADRLAAIIEPLLADPGRLENMGEAARRVGGPGAAGRVADLVERHGARR